MTLCQEGRAEKTATESTPEKLNAEQLALYGQAYGAFNKGDHEAAIALLRQALALGERDVLWLSLGRAHFRQGRCVEASKHYERALSAPAAGDPPASEIALRVARYRSDLRDQCPGTVLLSCDPPAMLLSVDGKKARACNNAKLTLTPGRHHLEASTEGRTLSQTISVVGLEDLSVTLKLTGPPPQPVKAPRQPTKAAPPASRVSALTIASWSVLATGGSVLLAGAITDATALGSTVSDFNEARLSGDPEARTLQLRAESLKTWVTASYLAGGIGSALGAGMVILGVTMRGDASQPALDGWLAPGQGGVRVFGRW